MKRVSSAIAGGVILTIFLSATALAAEGDKPHVATVEVAVPSAVSHGEKSGNETRAANHLLRTADSKRVPEKCGWGTAAGKICSEHARHGSSHFGRAKLLTVATTTPASSPFRLPASGTAAPATGVAADLLLDTDKADSTGLNRTVPVMDITQGTTASAHTVQAMENAVEHPAGAGTPTSEPPAYAVLLASLGIVAFIVTRRLN